MAPARLGLVGKFRGINSLIIDDLSASSSEQEGTNDNSTEDTQVENGKTPGR